VQAVDISLGDHVKAGQTLVELDLPEESDRILRAPRAGVVNAVRVRTGQYVNAGDIVAVVGPETPQFRLVMALPGHYRPALQIGTEVRLELSGFKYAYQDLRINSVENEVVGPNEVRRYLGSSVGDSISVEGPVVLAEAATPSNTFHADGREYAYYDGLQGRAEARVRQSSILVMFVPWVRALVDHAR